jgi:hypothetical protein
MKHASILLAIAVLAMPVLAAASEGNPRRLVETLPSLKLFGRISETLWNAGGPLLTARAQYLPFANRLIVFVYAR